MQVKGTGFGAGLGGIESEYRSQKIASRSLFRLTIIVIVTFISLSASQVFPEPGSPQISIFIFYIELVFCNKEWVNNIFFSVV